MTTYLAFLRGVNLGPNRRLAMADLRDIVTGMGMRDVQTLLQSGNVVFRCATRKPAAIERDMEAAIVKALKLETLVHVRTSEEWQAVIAHNPFPQEATRDPSHLLVTCLRDAPSPRSVSELQAAITGPERVRTNGREAYIVYPEGIARSKLTPALLDRKLGAGGTARNWNTVLKLGALTQGS
jgi:uncharacterized protein (DUF1697 family)